MAKLPWYSFLYRLLGAQGTFWLWILCLLVLWWTAEGALVRLANRQPRELTVQEAAHPPGLVRWVRLRGVGLALDRKLLLSREATSLPPVPLLLDADDPAARWWVETRAIALQAAGLPPETSNAEILSPEEARRQLIRRFAQLEGGERPLPAPERALLLQDRASLPLSAAPGGDPPGAAPLEAFVEQIEERARRLRERVQPQLQVEGVLDAVPTVVRERVEDELDVLVGPSLLRVGKRPAGAESGVFGAAALVLLFLAAGLYGATRVREAPADEAAPLLLPDRPEVSPPEPSP